MKVLGYPLTALVLLICCSSCVGTKKYKALEAQNEKITTTLLETKEELSAAKRNLNKLEDRSSSSQEELDASIITLQERLQKSQAQLNNSLTTIATLKEQSSERREQVNQQISSYEAQLKPYLSAKAVLDSEQKSLARLYQAIEDLLAQDSLAQVTARLKPAQLVVTFEQAYLFSSSERTPSTAARKNLEGIAKILKQYPRIHVDILGHLAPSKDDLGNWKSSTRKPLVVLYTLLKAGASPERIRLIGQGQYAPLVSGKTKEANARNARTELIFHYQGSRFIPTLVQP